jgi:glycerol uptake facilitator-like aquaporin
VAGAIVGVAAAHAMFELPLLQESQTVRSGPGQWWSECVATFGLVFLVMGFDKKTEWAAPFAIGGYIAAAYWFTASTSFANPAVTLARGFTATFAGIGIGNVPAFVVSQAVGAALAIVADRQMREYPRP